MGRKINPNGFRLAVTRDWSSQWYADKRDFAEYLRQDYEIRKYVMKACASAMVSRVNIVRLSRDTGPTVKISAARPGLIIGAKGEEIDVLRAKICEMTNTKDATVDVKEVRDADANAALVAMNIASRLEKRQRTRRVVQSTLQSLARQRTVLGVKIRVKGRLDGADIARKDYRHEGRVPLHTLRAEIDYGFAEAHTQMGQIGVKVWIFLGEKFARQKQQKHSLGLESLADEKPGVTDVPPAESVKAASVGDGWSDEEIEEMTADLGPGGDEGVSEDDDAGAE